MQTVLDMADLFKCDKCHQIHKLDKKSGRLIIQELGPDFLPHPSLYNRRVELCRTCFDNFCHLTQQSVEPRITFEEANAIVKESRT